MNADNGSSGNLHITQQGQGNGQCQKKPNTVTQQRKATETGKKSEHHTQSKQQTRRCVSVHLGVVGLGL